MVPTANGGASFSTINTFAKSSYIKTRGVVKAVCRLSKEEEISLGQSNSVLGVVWASKDVKFLETLLWSFDDKMEAPEKLLVRS